MTVDSIQSSFLESLSSQYTTTTEETDSEDSDTMLMEDFLTIFLTQLQYQDPLNPMEGTDMTAQIAQITMVEQQYNTNEILETVSQQLAEQQGDRLLEYIGKEVMIEGGAVEVKDGEAQGGVFYLEETAANVEIIIYDTEGNEITRLYPGELEAGEHEVTWDGTDSDGDPVEDEVYVYEVLATDDYGNDVTAETTFRGLVSGVTYESDEPYLMIGNGLIDPDDVLRVYDSTSSESTDTETTSDEGDV